MYSFLLRPWWLLSHLAVFILVVTMINLGFWQLSRHDDRAQRNDLVEQRADAEAVAVGAALARSDDPDQLQYVRVEAEGVYRDEASVLIANRTLDGAPGFWVMTPLAQADGTELWVARGFLNRGLVEQGDPSTWAAGDAPVSVVGLLAASAADGAFAGGAAPGGDRPAEASRPDTALLAGPDGADLGVYLQAESDASPALVAIPPPPLDGGPHISYAVQWFVFSLIAIIGYPLVLRRVARDRAGRESSAATLGDDEPVRA